MIKKLLQKLFSSNQKQKCNHEDYGDLEIYRGDFWYFASREEFSNLENKVAKLEELLKEKAK